MWILMVIIWIAISASAYSYLAVIVYLKDTEGRQNPYALADPQVYTMLVWVGLMFLLLVGHTIRLIVKGFKKLGRGVVKCTHSWC